MNNICIRQKVGFLFLNRTTANFCLFCVPVLHVELKRQQICQNDRYPKGFRINYLNLYFPCRRVDLKCPSKRSTFSFLSIQMTESERRKESSKNDNYKFVFEQSFENDKLPKSF